MKILNEYADSYFLFLQGIFDLLSLTGSFEPNKGGLVSGKLTVSLAIGGRVIQGPLAGSLVAAGPVKVNLLFNRISNRIFKNL
jgi:hypothetical protein